MVDKCASYSKMTVFETFDSEGRRVGNDDKMLLSKVFVVCKCPGGPGHFITAKCPVPGAHRASNAPEFFLGGCSQLELTRT